MSSRTPRTGGSRVSNAALSSHSRATPSRPANTPFIAQSQEYPLDRDAINALESLKRNAGGIYRSSLAEIEKDAAKEVNPAIEQMYSRLDQQRQRYNNRLSKAKDGEETEEDFAESKADLDAFEAKILSYDPKFDQCIREIIDHRKWIEGLPEAMKHVIDRSKEAHAHYEEAKQTAREGNPDDEDEERSKPQFDQSEQATALLIATTSTAELEWKSKPPTEKYGKNQLYGDFYKLRWDSLNRQDEAPPVPPVNQWFATEEGRPVSRRPVARTQTQTQDDGDDDMEDAESDTELQIAAERVSGKCPLSLQWFTEPVTSTKCPHSFQKKSIYEFINRSDVHAPLSPEQTEQLNERHPVGSRGRPAAEAAMQRGNKKSAKCPVCSVDLTVDDLRDDPVLLRKTKKAKEAQEAAEREDDSEDEEEDGFLRMTQRQNSKRTFVQVGSSPASRRPRIKGERQSVVPNTQDGTPSRRQTAHVDLDDDDDEDQEMSD